MATSSFNHKPVSTTVRTASYTIPAGRYARVVANVVGASSFSIGGVVALSSLAASWSVLASDNLSTFTAQGGIPRYLAVTGAQPANGTTQAAGSAFNEATAQMFTALSEAFWVPEGTVITGAGTWRATVEEYIG